MIRLMALAFYLCFFIAQVQSGFAEDRMPPVTAKIKVKSSLLTELTLEPVAQHALAPVLNLPGIIRLNARRLAYIAPSVSGRVMAIIAHLGDDITEGQLLATLNSTELGIAQAAYLKAKTQVNLRRLTAERSRRLLAEGILSVAEARLRDSELIESEVELSANAGQLAVMGMNAKEIQKLSQNDQISSSINLYASRSGTLIERNISIGKIVGPADTLFTIADLSGLWLEAEVPEQSAYMVEEGHEAEVSVPALQDKVIMGHVIYVADMVNPETRTVTLRMELDNHERKLKPEMLATVIVRSPGDTVLAIPAQSVVSEGEQEFVFLQTAADTFELRSVSLGRDHQGWRRVLQGLLPNDVIVTRGAFQLNTERLRKSLD